MSDELFGPRFQATLLAARRHARSLRAREDRDRAVRTRTASSIGVFAGHRRYSAGDDVRTVDWNAYARTRELFVKVFDAEDQRALTIVLDTTASMRAGARYDAARRFAALLGAMAFERVDVVRLVCGPDAIHTFERGAGMRALLQRLADRGIADVAPFDTVRAVADRPWLGTWCWLSDFATPEDFEPALRILRASGRRCTAVIPLLASDREPAENGYVRFVDEESGAAEVVRVDVALRAAMQRELVRLERRQDAAFAAAGQTCVRVPVPAPDDFRLTSWLADRWTSRI